MKSDTNHLTHNNHVFSISPQNEQAELSESKAINTFIDATQGTPVADVNAILQLLMEQNGMLMKHLTLSKTIAKKQPKSILCYARLKQKHT